MKPQVKSPYPRLIPTEQDSIACTQYLSTHFKQNSNGSHRSIELVAFLIASIQSLALSSKGWTAVNTRLDYYLRARNANIGKILHEIIESVPHRLSS